MEQELWRNILNTIDIEAKAVACLVNTISQENIIKTVKLLGDLKGKIILSGCGTSAMAARKIAHSLSCIERPACYLSPAEALHGALGLLQKDDVLILISKGGNTGELLAMIPACKTKGVALIAVTENEDSRLAAECDLLLKIKVEKEPCPFNMLATASTLAVIATFDAICIALMHYTKYTKEQFSVIHPGGAVGERLINEER